MRVRPWSFHGALGISRLIMGPNFVKALTCFESPTVDNITFIQLYFGSYEEEEEGSKCPKG